MKTKPKPEPKFKAKFPKNLGKLYERKIMAYYEKVGREMGLSEEVLKRALESAARSEFWQRQPPYHFFLKWKKMDEQEKVADARDKILLGVAEKCGVPDELLHAAVEAWHRSIGPNNEEQFFTDFAHYLTNVNLPSITQSRPVPLQPEAVASEIVAQWSGKNPMPFDALLELHTAIVCAMTVDRMQSLGMTQINCTYDPTAKAWVSMTPAPEAKPKMPDSRYQPDAYVEAAQGKQQKAK
jgi:hypothetical protein